MRRLTAVVLSSAFLLGCISTAAYAQKGVGDRTGVARQTVRPEIVALSGKLVQIKTGPCELTTGPSTIGTHVFLETPEGRKLNVHLGPAAAVAETVKKLSIGQEVSVAAFRTEKMKQEHYVATTLAFGGTTVTLRDEALRPVWAGGRGGGRGMGAGQGGRGMGAGQGGGGQRGMGAAQGRGSQGGMGAGQGRGGRGRGAGGGGGGHQWRSRRGPGYGGGRGAW